MRLPATLNLGAAAFLGAPASRAADRLNVGIPAPAYDNAAE